MREAGFAQTGLKIFSKVAPFFWWASYAFASGRVGARAFEVDLVRVVEIGGRLKATLQTQAQVSLAYRRQSIERARSVLAGNWCVLGFGIVKIPSGAGWHYDPVHNAGWPVRYFPFVDYVAIESKCDVKIAWELSRLQFLPLLAEGNVVDPDLSGPCRQRACNILTDWVKANPPGYGVNWTCAMEVAIRAVNILLCFMLLAENLDRMSQRLFIRALQDHMSFLQRFPETSDVTGNHYLCDLMGLVCLSSVGRDDGSFIVSANAFVSECEQQFEADGIHLERAPVYHRLCMDVLAIGAAFIHARQPSCASSLVPIHARGLGFAKSLACDEGLLPVFGDADGGMVLHNDSDPRSIRAHLELSAAKGDELFALWVRGLSGSNDFLRSTSESAPILGGYLALRSAATTIIMRAGPQGLVGRAPHDHDDATSVWVCIHGTDFIVDRGCHSYTIDPKLRAHDLVSSSHNVLKPRDRERYAGREGSIHLTMRGAPVCNDFDVKLRNDGGVMHAALEDVSGISRIERRVEAKAGSFVVADTCESDMPLVLNWHFAPGIFIAPEGDGRFILSSTEFAVHLAIEGKYVRSFEVFEYDFAPNYGAKIQAAGLAIQIEPQGSCMIRSIFDVTTVLTQS